MKASQKRNPWWRLLKLLVITCVLLLVTIWCIAVYIRYPGKSGSCPDLTASELNVFLTRYFNRKRDTSFTVLPGAFESGSVDDRIWMVPVVHEGKDYFAMVDCHGGIELSGRR
ncbi:hypothetical protein PAQ31011_05200 [Pandoraea aquatica]|uniref:Uncharacterized protein n=1 Tax=Pandoraea aquatica TaxID=2508290 RepID=A0A5E4Z945_9BURK|nr:hypothetical protein [Pandoraea aquatica]VVE57318.1 hypothetical protein PAQ31011_05200 [Pandoraea aquatica]